MILVKMRDDKFTEDIENACHRYHVETGHWHGDSGLRREEKKLVVDYDWDAVFEACLNVLDRRGMLVS